jgi:hypothetical protein
MPDKDLIDENDKIYETIEFLLEISGNLKLDLIDNNGKRLVKDPKAPEIHYMRCESKLKEHSVDI